MREFNREKLPRAARVCIENLERRVRELEADLRTALGNGEGAVLFLDPNVGKRPVPGDRVRFLLGTKDWRQFVDVAIVRGEDGSDRVEIRGGDALAIRPCVSNTIEVELVRF